MPPARIVSIAACCLVLLPKATMYSRSLSLDYLGALRNRTAAARQCLQNHRCVATQLFAGTMPLTKDEIIDKLRAAGVEFDVHEHQAAMTVEAQVCAGDAIHRRYKHQHLGLAQKKAGVHGLC